MGDYLWIPIVLALFVLVPLIAVLIKRFLVWSYKRVTGLEKKEAALSEEAQRMYRNPDWEYYDKHLGRSVPMSLRHIYEKLDLASNPIVRIDMAEYYFYPIQESELVGGSELGLNVLRFAETELGEPIYLKPNTSGNSDTIYYFMDLEAEEVLYEHAQDFVSAIEEMKRTSNAA